MINPVPESMRAVVLTSPGKFELRTLPVPKPGRGEVLCRIMAVAICGSDPKIIRGDSAGTWPPSYPFIIGHEWAGEVVACGEGVTTLKPGDRVAGEAHCGCGTCKNCMAGNYNLCLNYGKSEAGHRHYGHLSSGAYAQYSVYSSRAVTKMPDSVSFLEGSLVDTAGTALHLLRLTGVPTGGTVVVIGPGPVGLLTARMASILGASRIGMVGRGDRLDLAGKSFADWTVNFEKEDVVSAVRANTEDGLGADVVLECSGSPGTLNQGIGMLKRGGVIGLVGVPPAGKREEIPFRTVVLDQITIKGSRANPNASSAALSLMGSEILKVKDLITHTFPMEKFETALDYFVNRKDGAVKVVVLPQEGKEAR